MTDTTDIKALRELLCHENKESDHHIGVTVTTLRLLLSKADQLEAERHKGDLWFGKVADLEAALKAERQRVADLVLQVNTQANMREKAVKERDDLKSAHGNMVTRCALLRQRTDLPVDRIPAYNTLVKAQGEVKELRAKMANPVVLGPSINPAMFNADVMFGYDKARTEDKEAIHAAGFNAEVKP